MQIGDYNLPDELYYHADHAWVKVDGGTVTVGMSDFYQAAAGDVVYVDLPFEGDDIEAGEICGKLQSAKWIGNLVAPVSGEIVEVNEAVADDSTLINTDPYGEGWLLKIEASNLEEELGGLMQGEAVTAWIESEIERAEKLKAEGG